MNRQVLQLDLLPGMCNNPVPVTDPSDTSEENQSAPDVVIRMDNPYTDGYSELSATSAGIGKMVRVSGGDGHGPGDPPKVDPWGAIVGKVKSFWKSLGFSDEDAPSVQETTDYVEELGDNLQPMVDVLTAPIPGGSLLNPGASGGQKALDVGLSIFPGVGFIDDAGRLVVKGVPKTLYHYTSKEAAASISQNGLRVGRDGFSYLTNNGTLKPLQAQIELALPSNRALPNSVLQINSTGLNPSIIRRVQGNLPGYGAGGELSSCLISTFPQVQLKFSDNMEERIKTAIEFLQDGQAFTVGDLRLSAEKSEVLEVTGWSRYKNFSNLSKEQSLKELEELKALFYRMTNLSRQLKDFSESRKIEFNLCYDDYGKGSVLICSQTLEKTKWNVDLK